MLANSTSENTSVVPVPATAVAPGDLAAGQGEPARKLPLAVRLRPIDPWKGLVVAFGATTPFADGYFEARGARRGSLAVLILKARSPELPDARGRCARFVITTTRRARRG